VLVRHGASEPAIAGRRFPLRDGHGDPALAPEGEHQAALVAERLAAEPLAGLFITTLRRTAQTAAPLAARLGLEPVVVPDLREVSLGEWEGGEFRVRLADGDPIAVQAVVEERWEVIPGAEAMEPFAVRVRAGIEAVVAAAGAGVTVAAIAHGGVIGEVCRQATDSRPFAFVHAENGSLTRLVVLEGGRWLLRSFNDTSHLAAPA
jgi:2,3-bisphosphoglycerate-dependent phosphoglycerate mutase